MRGSGGSPRSQPQIIYTLLFRPQLFIFFPFRHCQQEEVRKKFQHFSTNLFLLKLFFSGPPVMYEAYVQPNERFSLSTTFHFLWTLPRLSAAWLNSNQKTTLKCPCAAVNWASWIESFLLSTAMFLASPRETFPFHHPANASCKKVSPRNNPFSGFPRSRSRSGQERSFVYFWARYVRARLQIHPGLLHYSRCKRCKFRFQRV